MKQSDLSFAAGFLGLESKKAYFDGNPQKAFDWDRAAEIIKEKLTLYPNLKAEAGLHGDWDYTGGVIFENGKPTNKYYTYLQSNWATPTLILEVEGEEILELGCFTDVDERFNADTKWDKQSLEILGIEL